MWWRRNRTPSSSALPERLEPRILYSADFSATLLGAVTDAQPQEQRVVDASGDYVSTGQAAEASQALADLPLIFETNVGQTDDRVDFIARGADQQVYLAEGDAVIVLAHGDGGHVVRLDLVGANESPAAIGVDAVATQSNYLIGEDATQWQTGIANYTRVHYADVYQGIDLVYYGDGHQLEYDFLVAAGADPSQIRLRFDGADEVAIADNGDLVLRIGEREMRFLAPVSYQRVRRPRSGRQPLLLLDREHRVRIRRYDASRTLVVDRSSATHLSHRVAKRNWARIAVDAAGYVYIRARPNRRFPRDPGAYKTQLQARTLMRS